MDLGFDHAVLGGRRLLIGHQLLCVAQPAQQRLQSILELPTMQQGLLQLRDALGDLRAERTNVWMAVVTATRANLCLVTHPLVERVPSEVGGLQVVLQSLRVRVLGGALDQTLTHRVDVLQLRLNPVHLLTLQRLREETRRRVKERRRRLFTDAYSRSESGLRGDHVTHLQTDRCGQMRGEWDGEGTGETREEGEKQGGERRIRGISGTGKGLAGKS